MPHRDSLGLMDSSISLKRLKHYFLKPLGFVHPYEGVEFRSSGLCRLDHGSCVSFLHFSGSLSEVLWTSARPPNLGWLPPWPVPLVASGVSITTRQVTWHLGGQFKMDLQRLDLVLWLLCGCQTSPWGLITSLLPHRVRVTLPSTPVTSSAIPQHK